MKTSRCIGCKERFERESCIKTPSGYFHDFDCLTQYLESRQRKAFKAKVNREKKARGKKSRADKLRVRTRSEWYEILQNLVNQYVLHVRDKGKPCFTCGTTNDIKYDAGHYRSVGSCMPLRFELTNIHKQCSVQCNGHKSSNRAEYIPAIIAKYGNAHLDWLDGPHPLLKDQFPHVDDINAEILRCRKLLKDNGLKPRA